MQEKTVYHFRLPFIAKTSRQGIALYRIAQLRSETVYENTGNPPSFLSVNSEKKEVYGLWQDGTIKRLRPTTQEIGKVPEEILPNCGALVAFGEVHVIYAFPNGPTYSYSLSGKEKKVSDKDWVSGTIPITVSHNNFAWLIAGMSGSLVTFAFDRGINISDSFLLCCSPGVAPPQAYKTTTSEKSVQAQVYDVLSSKRLCTARVHGIPEADVMATLSGNIAVVTTFIDSLTPLSFIGIANRNETSRELVWSGCVYGEARQVYITPSGYIHIGVQDRPSDATVYVLHHTKGYVSSLSFGTSEETGKSAESLVTTNIICERLASRGSYVPIPTDPNDLSLAAFLSSPRNSPLLSVPELMGTQWLPSSVDFSFYDVA